jgi:EmrB/QacA subfamily drug resistance transporter
VQAVTHNRKWWTLAAVTFAVFITTLDNTIVNVALPSIQGDLELTRSGLEWVVNAYILAFAVLLLTGGRLADAFGRRRLFLVGLGVFTGASLLGGFAGSEEVLIVARALQGAGAALMTPTTLAIISATFSERQRGLAVGIWAAVAALAFAVGPVTGGFLAEHLHWSWIFFLNVPVGIAGLLVGRLAIPESRDDSVGRRVDARGLVTSGAGLLALTYALIGASDRGWSSPATLGLLGAAAVALGLFVRSQRRGRAPMLPFSLFRDRVFAGANALVLLSGFAIFGILFFTSLFLQQGLGFSAVEAGAVFVPMAILLTIVSPLSSKLADRLGLGRVVAAGMTLTAVGLFLLSRLDEGASFASVLSGILVAGIGSGLTTPLFSAVLGSVTQQRAGVASGALNTARELGGALGIAIMGAILAGREMEALAGGASPAAAFTSGYSAALLVAAGVMLAAAIVAWRTLAPRAPLGTEPLPQPA